MFKNAAYAKPTSGGLNTAETGVEEEVEGVVVRHRVLPDGTVPIHYVEGGQVDGPLVIERDALQHQETT